MVCPKMEIGLFPANCTSHEKILIPLRKLLNLMFSNVGGNDTEPHETIILDFGSTKLLKLIHVGKIVLFENSKYPNSEISGKKPCRLIL